MNSEIKPLSEIEKDYILRVVHSVRGNLPVAADKLGIGLLTLYRKLHKYGYEFPNKRRMEQL